MVLKLRRLGIQYFNRIIIWSLNEEDMTNWSNTAQRACCYEIAYKPDSFRCLGWILGLFLGSIFVAIRPFEFSIFTNPIFGCRTIFGNLDFIQILITKYAIGSLKAMRIFLFSYSLIYIYVYIYIDRLYMWPQDILVFLIENKFLCFFQIGKLI